MLALEIDFKNVVLVTSNGQKISAFINRAKNLSNNHKCEKAKRCSGGRGSKCLTLTLRVSLTTPAENLCPGKQRVNIHNGESRAKTHDEASVIENCVSLTIQQTLILSQYLK